jgi:hypothetical protein
MAVNTQLAHIRPTSFLRDRSGSSTLPVVTIYSRAGSSYRDRCQLTANAQVWWSFDQQVCHKAPPTLQGIR